MAKKKHKRPSTYLNLGIFVHEDRDDAHVRQEAPGPAHNVLFGQPQLVGCIQAPVVHVVIVALGQELDGSVLSAEKIDWDYMGPNQTKRKSYRIQ